MEATRSRLPSAGREDVKVRPLMPQPLRCPSVDVVVVNYNGANGGMLERCLTSVARTQYTNFRVTVVDNGSTDGSRVWFSEFAPMLI